MVADPSAELVDRVQELTEQLEQVRDVHARTVADELVAAIMQLYGAGLERIVAALEAPGASAAEARDALVDDGVVASLLLIHGLYPVDLETRVNEALDSVRPYMASHGGDVELLGVEDGVARLRLAGHCDGCPASESTLELTIRRALEEAAPDLEGLEVEGAAPPPSRPAGGFDLPVVHSRQRRRRAARLDGARRAGAVRRHDGGRQRRRPRAAARQRGRDAARLPQRVRLVPRAARRRADDAGRHADVPVLRSPLRAAARRPLARRRPAPAPARAALARRGRGARGGRVMAGAAQPALVAGLRRYLREPAAPGPARAAEPGRCELCPMSLSEDHKHLLDLEERRIVCVCATCWSVRSGDARYRPPGSRTVWLEDFALPDDLWAAFEIPIGLAFFLRSGAAGGVVGLYPSPAGATECELDLDAWERLVAANPVLDDLDTDAEALIVNRLATPHAHAIAPLDDCYRLVGIIKATWEGIAGGKAMEAAVEHFFADLRAGAAPR